MRYRLVISYGQGFISTKLQGLGVDPPCPHGKAFACAAGLGGRCGAAERVALGHWVASKPEEPQVTAEAKRFFNGMTKNEKVLQTSEVLRRYIHSAVRGTAENTTEREIETKREIVLL